MDLTSPLGREWSLWRPLDDFRPMDSKWWSAWRGITWSGFVVPASTRSDDRRPRIGLIVPSLASGGGVPAVARFIKDVILRSNHYDLKLVSLATSSRDETSLGLLAPAQWRRGPAVEYGTWEGLPFAHVGAAFGELEFQRYRPRRVLTEVLEDCSLLQVVSGSPAWANAVCGLGKPVSLQVATRARVERRRRDS